MSLEGYATKWFAFYYSVLALCLIGGGGFLILKKQQITRFFLDAANDEKPPRLLIRILKYFLLFTLPGLIFSFIPFSWIELLFSIWSLLVVYIAGIQLVRWNQQRTLIRARSEELPNLIRRSGAMMVAVGSAIFLLAYLVIN